MFRFSRADIEGNLNVSKWLNIQFLLDETEIRDLFQAMGDFLIVPVGRVIDRSKPVVLREDFLKAYDNYIQALRLGHEPEIKSYSSIFSEALSIGFDEFYAIEVASTTMLVKPLQPVIQMQAHSMNYSPVDETIYPMVRGSDTITWGLQLGFPTLYQGRKQKNSSNTLKEGDFRNGELFQRVQKWMRQHTRPTPVMIRQKVINIPVRIGHQCFSWINNHPNLRYHGLVIDGEGDEG